MPNALLQTCEAELQYSKSLPFGQLGKILTPTADKMYSRDHPTRGIGSWLVLLVIYAVIGSGSNMRWS